MRALFAVLLVACACSNAPTPADALDPREDVERHHSVVFADPDLSGEIKVGTPVTERLAETNLLAVHVPIRNASDKLQQLSVQVEFFDKERVPYDDVTPKRLVLVPRGGTLNYSATSTKARAQDFVVRLWRYRRD